MKILNRIVSSVLAVAMAATAFMGCELTMGNGEDRASVSGYAPVKIEVTGQTTSFVKGDEFTLGSGVVTATFSDDSTKVVTDDVTVSGFDSSAVAEAVEITLSYTAAGKTVTAKYDVKVTNTVESIAIKTAPTATSAITYASPNLAGMVITVTYSDSSTEDVTYSSSTSESFTVSPEKFETAGNAQTVTVTYSGKSATYTVDVKSVAAAAAAAYALDGNDEGLTIVGSGSYVDDDTFTTVYKNVGGAQRSSYIDLGNVLSKCDGAEAITIGFWVKGTSGEFWSPLLGAYAETSNTNGGLWLEARGVLGINWGGAYYDYANESQNITWLEDGEWHYYTCVINSDGSAATYNNGTVLFSWDASEDSAAGVAGFFANLTTLGCFCVGGNQAWAWTDNDTPYSYAKVSVWDVALNEEQIASVVAAK